MIVVKLKLKKNNKPHRFLRFQEFIELLNNNKYKVKNPNPQLQEITPKRWFNGTKLPESLKQMCFSNSLLQKI